jgi:hypothetical protein|tara:strand:- start:1693 stop:2172 length:480 start_codon:yes stop_codon:yes gene_type:complete
MSKSYAQMADEILGGALSDSTKNPYDPTTGHQSHLPAMNPDEKLVEMSDAQRHSFLKNVAGVEVQELKEHREVEPSPAVVTPEEVDTLNEALRIIQKIQEATTVGNIGVNMAGGQKGEDPKKITVPGDTDVCKSKAPMKREKKIKKRPASDFLAYLKAK